MTVNGKLRTDHPYISAVAVVFERERAVDFYDELVAGMEGTTADEQWWAMKAAKDRRGEDREGHYHRLDIYGSVSPRATLLAVELFNAPKDRPFSRRGSWPMQSRKTSLHRSESSLDDAHMAWYAAQSEYRLTFDAWCDASLRNRRAAYFATVRPVIERRPRRTMSSVCES